MDDAPLPPTDLRSAGTAYLYVLPCLGEDLAKVGFSRDPLARMQSLHPRWFEFFDLDRAWAVEVDRVDEARALEREQRARLRDRRSAAPLTATRAQGVTEWYRGAAGYFVAESARLSGDGHRVLDPLRPWLAARLTLAADLLREWTTLLDADALDARGRSAAARPEQRRVVDVLDACVALGIALEPRLTPRVLDWYADATRWRPFAPPV